MLRLLLQLQVKGHNKEKGKIDTAKNEAYRF
jgi:hypothetical protein